MSAVLEACLVSLLPILAILAALKDLTSYTIPNWISLALAGAFAPGGRRAACPCRPSACHVAAGFVALLAGMGLFAFGWIGGGDAKLLSACCLWFGWPGGRDFLLDTALAGGAFALLLIVARGQMVRAVPAPDRVGRPADHARASRRPTAWPSPLGP